MVKKFRKAVDHIESRVRRDVVFHIFLNCPAALAVGLGASIDCLKKVVVYHYNVAPEPVSELNGSLSGSYRYLRVIDLSNISPHILKQRVGPNYDYINKQQVLITDGNDVCMALGLSSHNPGAAARSFAQKNKWSLICLDNKYNGHLSRDQDWLQVMREVVSELLRLGGQEGVRIHLVLSAPIAMAFAIGMGLGMQMQVTVYNWFRERQTYIRVLDLNKLQLL
ncbi:SAVED domain-containing protein [Thermobaculum terrenum]|uniref:SAVED domain-containing protein n=1 Tax=Thermobaculum terrenum TaxID=166501 RepID=UPI00145DE5CA|nr:SAVED domain-containing protein [Thermobaculum terrenum]